MPHHEWVFRVLFSSDDDKVIVDAVCVWVVDAKSVWVVDQHRTQWMMIGLCARDLAGRVERGAPFSPR